MGTAAAVFDPFVEAAVLARYGVDPHTATLRRLHVLLRAMPPGYWPDASQEASWSVEAHLLAGLLDAVNQSTWVLASVNSKRRVPRPDKVPRPGRAARRGLSVGELGRMMMGGGSGG